MDLNVDGSINKDDVITLVDNLLRTSRGDFNLDRRVDGADFLIWQRGLGTTGHFELGDGNFDGAIGGADLALLRAGFGSVAPLATIAGGAVPEPAGPLLALVALAGVQRLGGGKMQ